MKNTAVRLLAALLLAALLAGCGSAGTDPVPETSAPAPETASEPEPAASHDASSDASDEKSAAGGQTELDHPIVYGKNIYFFEEQIPPSLRDELLRKAAQGQYETEVPDYGSAEEPAPEPAEEPAAGSAEYVAAFGGRRSKVERVKSLCYVRAEDPNNANPYDVTWDYGSDYTDLVASLDWAPVFDADYYMQTFPVLALQYNYRTDLLLKHFQTAGIHEGRQGSENFNVKAYMTSCDQSLRDAFGENYECYYIYYLMNYQTQKSVPATGNYPKQLTARMTAIQAEELDGINMYRAEAGVQPVVFDSEMAALANYRAYTNAVLHVHGHDWIHDEENMDQLRSAALDRLEILGFGENTVAGVRSRYELPVKREPAVEGYRRSPGHYANMIDSRYNYCGSSHYYITNKNEIENFSDHETEGYYNIIEFDVFTPSLSTPLNP